jgi:hypothetical protein
MRTTKELRDKIEEAATASGRSLVQEVEFRLERSFRQQEIERGLKKALEARIDSFRDEMSKTWNDWRDEMVKAMGITREQLAATAAKEPRLSDLSRYLPKSPGEETSEHQPIDKEENSK